MEDNIIIESQIFGTIRILPHKFSFDLLLLTLKTVHGLGRRDYWTSKFFYKHDEGSLLFVIILNIILINLVDMSRSLDISFVSLSTLSYVAQYQH